MTYFFYFESPTKIRNTSGIPKKYPKYWVEFELLKTALRKKITLLKNKLRTAATSVATISFLLGRKIFSENSHETINRHQQYHCYNYILKIKHFFNYLKI